MWSKEALEQKKVSDDILKAALEEVKFCADDTWYTSPYQRANKVI